MESQNWMYDDTKETLGLELSKEELCNRLTVQKIEYGRLCLRQFACQLDSDVGCPYDWVTNLDKTLAEKIRQLGVEPKNIEYSRK